MKVELRRVTVRTPRAQDARRSWPERESLLLRISDARGQSGVGEASPLPGYSPDRLDDVETELGRLDSQALAAALELLPARAALRAVASLMPIGLPSARMALETAALDLLGRRLGMSAPILLGAASSATRQLAELVGPASSSSLLQDAERAVRAGFKHLKLKLGSSGLLERELAGVTALRQRLGASAAVRLDANGSLTAEDLELAWPELARLGIEWFEEPGPVPERLASALPLALDESLQGLDEAQVEALLRLRKPRCVVLKPMALGGLDHCWRLAERARDVGADAIISHCFDGPFAWRAAAALALALPRGPAHGLAPHAGLEAWSMNALPVRQGCLETWSEPGLGAPAEHGFQ
jgi:o-succinylbenzoate synthase